MGEPNIGISRNNDPQIAGRDEQARVLEFENTKYENKDCFGWRSAAYGYFTQCRREYGDGSKAQTEDYIAPHSHAVRMHLSEERLAHLKGRFCTWIFTPVVKEPPEPPKECDKEFVVYKVPYPDGGTVTVVDEHNAMIAQDKIVVRDVLVLGLGNSYASGEGNPDVPVQFAGSPVNANFRGPAFRSAKRTLKYTAPIPRVLIDCPNWNATRNATSFARSG